jgi:hypothetical protein
MLGFGKSLKEVQQLQTLGQILLVALIFDGDMYLLILNE